MCGSVKILKGIQGFVKNWTVILFVGFFLWGCTEEKDYYHFESLSSNGFFVGIIEIPAGTNKKMEYNPIREKFEQDTLNGKPRVVSYLPYPGNYGFIPSTLSDKKNGGDGDALDILILSESVSTGAIVEFIPIAVIKLIDDGEEDYKIIGVPAHIQDRIINVETFADLKKHYPGVLSSLENWFLNYNPLDEAQIIGWGNELDAKNEIVRTIKLKI